LPFSFFTFSFAIDSIVLAIDNLASGNNTFDNLSKVAYVSFVSETFSKNYALPILKFVLALILCSQTQQICMPPHQWPELFNSQYDCLMFGYKESQKKMKEIGRKEVNEHNMFIRFTCTPQNTIWQYGKIVVMGDIFSPLPTLSLSL
jgi:hypothetical protein